MEPHPSLKKHTFKYTNEKPALKGDWDDCVWSKAPVVYVDHFYEGRSQHRPKVACKTLYDDDYLYLHFMVEDRYIISRVNEHQGRVFEDSCVEFFIKPSQGGGYFNFEINAGGKMRSSFVEDPTMVNGELKKRTFLPASWFEKVLIYHSLPSQITEEIKEEKEWHIEYAIPISLFEHYVGKLGSLKGQTWTANFYKIANLSSHPHFASWSLIEGEVLAHKPEYFGMIQFGE